MTVRSDPSKDEDAPLVCDRCGKVPAQRIAHRVLCDDCYHALGDCCQESEEPEPDFPSGQSSSSKSDR